MALEDVRVLHRKDVRGRSPLARREYHWRRVTRFSPRPEHGADGGQPVERDAVEHHQYVVVRTPGDVLPSHRGAVKNHGSQGWTVYALKLGYQLVNSHRCASRSP